MSNTDNTWLNKCAKNYFSQAGEDGINEKILEIIPDSDQWVVEFGAWDGIHLSNSRHFIEKKNFSAVLIEGSKSKFQSLVANNKEFSNVYLENKLVSIIGENSLDNILLKTPIPSNFDLCIIDIDGCDYHVWESFVKYQPKVVCIEFNPTIPNEVDFVQDADFNVSFGNSLTALNRLAKKKGYELVSATTWNAFFVDEKYFSLFNIDDNRPETLRTDLRVITYLFSGYNGEVKTSGYNKVFWHDIAFDQGSIQQMPKFLRKFPDELSDINRYILKLFKKIKRLKSRFASK